MFAKVAVAAFALTFVQSALAGPCVRQYTIQDGDICDSISAANNVSTYQLAKINEGYIDATCSNLQPGATICIGYENEDCSTTYTVKAQDSCSIIADAHAINTTMLYLNNPQIDGECSNIYVGEVLCVGSQVQVPPHTGVETVATGIPTTATAAVSATPTDETTTASSSASSTADETTAASATPTDDGDDDDEDLPFCDEL